MSLASVRHALVIAPHPDDETIGAFGLICALKHRSAKVSVVVVTDGAGSHRNSVRWPSMRLVAARRRETLTQMRGIGVCAKDVTFLGLADGALSQSAGLVDRTVRQAIAKASRVDLLVFPARDDDHPDHRTVAGTVTRGRARLLQYLVWPNRQTGPRPATHCLRLGPAAAAKRAAIRRYRSQMGAITDDPAGFAISRTELAAFSRPVERFRQVPQ